jgi:hypothetical protein
MLRGKGIDFGCSEWRSTEMQLVQHATGRIDIGAGIRRDAG